LKFIPRTAFTIEDIAQARRTQPDADVFSHVVRRGSGPHFQFQRGPILDVARLHEQLVTIRIIGTVSDRGVGLIERMQEEELAHPQPLLPSNSGFSSTGCLTY
jgi:hypothetical protein